MDACLAEVMRVYFGPTNLLLLCRSPGRFVDLQGGKNSKLVLREIGLFFFHLAAGTLLL